MSTLTESLKKAVQYWWTYLIAGILLLIVSGLVLAHPAASYVGLSVYFAVAILGSGIMYIAFSISNRDVLPGWGWYLTGGVIDIIIGIYLLTYPVVAAATLPLYIGFWLLFRSFSAMSTGFDLRAMGVKGWGWISALAVLGLALSVSILFSPNFGAATVILFTSFAMLALGVVSVVIAFRLRNLGHAFKHQLT